MGQWIQLPRIRGDRDPGSHAAAISELRNHIRDVLSTHPYCLLSAIHVRLDWRKRRNAATCGSMVRQRRVCFDWTVVAVPRIKSLGRRQVKTYR